MSTARTAIHRRGRLRRLQLALAALGVLLLSAILLALLVDRIFFQNSSSPAATGSGVAATQTRSVPPFTGIDLAGDNNVIVQVGASQAVVVHADSNLLGRVTTRVRSGRLVIGTTPGNLSARSPMFVAVAWGSTHGVIGAMAANRRFTRPSTVSEPWRRLCFDVQLVTGRTGAAAVTFVCSGRPRALHGLAYHR